MERFHLHESPVVGLKEMLPFNGRLFFPKSFTSSFEIDLFHSSSLGGPRSGCVRVEVNYEVFPFQGNTRCREGRTLGHP